MGKVVVLPMLEQLIRQLELAKAKGKATGGAAAPEDEQKEAFPTVALDPLVQFHIRRSVLASLYAERSVHT